VDGAGSAYVTGTTRSRDFPLHNSLQGASAGGADAFVVKLTPAGDALAYSTLLGGSRDDGRNAIAVDAAGAAYVVGVTWSRDFPLQRPLQATFGGRTDAFAAKLAPAGDTLVYASYLGDRHHERARGVAVDADGAAYVTGRAESRSFPFQVIIDKLRLTHYAVPVVKLTPDGSVLVHFTALRGDRPDRGNAIAVDSTGAAYVAGVALVRFQLLNAEDSGPIRSTTFAAFVAKLKPAGDELAYLTHLDGRDDETAMAVAVDAAGVAHVGGTTSSWDFPLAKPLQNRQRSVREGFVARIVGPAAEKPELAVAASTSAGP